ncbi:CDP-glycerol glycerophosphotransferase [Pilibacter termitis]|uniref:CDP-glycerol glycerophosphotransferase n=1 Tax=Pilibacter termitis TaxID=263852 RepID=A0A1T4R046_9ENTE|nr:CDP-glycerol glycerophosphotransferase family protein [Pilibacter termitis]SKA09256.1 CDP-glycerol glycerophosphotransferase [Pilibacter termitis]
MLDLSKLKNRIQPFAEPVTRVLFKVLSCFVNKRLVVFESFHGKNYSDSPRAMYEYFCLAHPEYKCVWVAARGYEHLFKEAGVPYVKKFSLRFYATMPRAKFWIINTRTPLYMKKSKKTIYLQTWHGTPLKHIGLDTNNKDRQHQEELIAETQRWDILLSANKYSTEKFQTAFDYRGKILEKGYPRNDILQQENEKKKSEIRERLGISSDKKVVLYAPTWREDRELERQMFEFENELPINEILTENEDVVILMRLHYLSVGLHDEEFPRDRVLDVTMYSDISHLYLISDLLITDYSSVMFDFAFTRKPMLFYMYDQERYHHNRGYYFEPKDILPGEIISERAMMPRAVRKKLESNEIDEKYEHFYQKFCIEQTNASQEVVEYLLANY